ncbi:DUF1653 domain-containing protein [Saccharophagus degradans]|uniref:DUF1653 domain-containing protein n=1 Tax=Saccharophagus degradans TaxID=86304 RepID=UPI0024780863|nr:DUF1653 domain-containing protein [Saccharophagus degradans]WGO97082.1 DUF1653 domain-containing protein [Saccharophagus degradans]
MNDKITLGKYRHYKGNEYYVEDVARHSEDLSYLVVYRCLYGEFGLWVRPLEMFLEDVTIDGVVQPRFAYQGPLTSADIDVMPEAVRAKVLANQ